ncbi:MAG TPA: type II pantothenate kinase [Firmicutes bacterium]|uniref:Type II pantothenate kinase n=1 Tax=Capillibacterium thermochitinicola TaxID=2699427 RepID=A0A8J6I015_9FIRM|nr:type II pantothenate kinase [Capillibacterium thermochitinicola]MBA2132264.1 type II pantothenate kinase [Capillibacterium thermochitinicola]HHW12932.1 type II pantothenate kinase [Bacillota bacterium]
MGMVIGIDVGGSTTKIVGLHDHKVYSPLLVKANDPVASIYGAFGKFINANGLTLNDIEHVMITGVGSSYIHQPLYGIPTTKVDEFRAIGKGGLFLSKLPRAIVVSMGTGTAYIMADEQGEVHMGGTGVGGGTLLGLSSKMLNIRHFDDLIAMAEGGNLAHIDLNIGDITQDQIVGLPPETTASNFGKISDLATKADIALGIINLVFQTIGMLAVFATRIYNTRDVVLTGNLTTVPQSQAIFEMLHRMYQVQFHTPPYAEFATATGAALSLPTAGNRL